MNKNICFKFYTGIPTCIIILVLWCAPVLAADWIIDGTVDPPQVMATDKTVAGSVIIRNGGKLTIDNATLTLQLSYDEEFWIEVDQTSQLFINNGVIQSLNYQYWIEIWGDGTVNPSLQVTGTASKITMHSGIRPYDKSQIIVTGGDVEELQAHDQVSIDLQNAATYLVLFFDNQTATLNNLDTYSDPLWIPVTNTINVPGGWSVNLVNAQVDGYQIDLMNNSNVTLNNSDGIVLSVHTPGDLTGLRIVEGLTSKLSGAMNNLGSTFTYNNCDLALINVYTFGSDRVLLRDLHVNEVNAQETSEITIGQAGYTTILNCNLCQVYDNATFNVVNCVIDNVGQIPSATASFHDTGYTIGTGVMNFRGMDLRNLQFTAIEAGTINLYNCLYDPTKMENLNPPSSKINIYNVPLLNYTGLIILVIITGYLLHRKTC